MYRILALVRLVTSIVNVSPDDFRGWWVGFIISAAVSVFRSQPVLKPSENLLFKGIIYADLNAALAEQVIKTHPAGFASSSCCSRNAKC